MEGQEEEEEPEEEEYSPPCRVAAKYRTNCPQCGRQVSLKTLRYTHMCHRTHRPNERALEQLELAETAVLQRITTQGVKDTGNCTSKGAGKVTGEGTGNRQGAPDTCKYTSVLETVQRMGEKRPVNYMNQLGFAA